MEVSNFFIVTYVFFSLLLCIGFLLYKKSEEKLYLATWLPVAAVGLMGYQTMVAGIFGILNIPINVATLTITNGIPAIIIWVLLLKNKKIQSYVVEKADIIMWLALLFTIIIYTYLRHSFDLLINYKIDASVHFNSAMYMVRNSSVYTMFFAMLHNGLIIQCLSPFFTPTFYFQAYIIGDVLCLLLAGVMFWGVIRRYCNTNFMKFAGMFATLMYLVGYPLSSTMFGFSYLGLGVTVIGFIIIVANIYAESDINKKLLVALLSFGCVSIFEAYALFVPAVFFSLLTFILVQQFISHKLISIDTILTGLGVFLLPTIIGLYYIYGGIFNGGDTSSGGVTVASAIATEGGIYRNLFSNFILLVPLAIFAFATLIKKRKNNIMLHILPMELIFVAVMFAMALIKKVSTYYYFKNYYVLWLLFAIMGIVALYYLEKQAKMIVTLIISVWFMVILAGIFQVDDIIIEKNYLLHERIGAENFGDIYIWNRNFLFLLPQSSEKIELYRYVNEELIGKDVTDKVMIASSFDDQYWFGPITNQKLPKYAPSEQKIIIDENMAQYVVVVSDCIEYSDYKDLFENYERIYETSSGYIVRLY